ncbi:GIY-YIG nuclease family protein [Aquiflexum sp. TKW24L]|uniref:GIY-YIG nuclease family protein n=1 Tax=Aquiflexum sp. TKW24L TaxID=2942212 RepID=UPI0020BD5703|nr:GIY-YIG nuclease family protein [Aquiflexum sp. TKW24L]MCL6258763.1 GIY-YIG nuclease family protein [Aquiflexum sp. TKW24L]
MLVPSIGKVAGSSPPDFRDRLSIPQKPQMYLGLFVFMEYFVYILKSYSDGSFYVGSTSDPAERLKKHNSPHKGYTGKKHPWEFVYVEKFLTKSDAIKRESFIKRQKSKQYYWADIR